MSSVDERIVQMKFDNNQFESGVKTTLESLENLKKGLNFENLETGVAALQKRFSTLGIMGMEVTKRLTNAAIDAGKNLANATLGQIKSGGMSRALNIEQAQFRLKGILKDGKLVAKVMDNASAAVDGTAYGLDEAASAASVLAASGVKAGSQMESVLKSISGAAAMTGRSYSDIANIYSTVASNGKLMTMQLRQFSAAGLNVSAVLKEAGINGATTEEQINDMVTKGQISFDQFSQAMEQFGEHAQKANDTFSGSLANMKSALSRIGELFARPYITNMRYIFNATKDALNKVKQTLLPFSKYIERQMARIRKSVVKAIKSLTGKYNPDKLIFSPIVAGTKTLVRMVKILINVLKPAKKAFANVFPNATIKNLGKFLILLNDISKKALVKVKDQSEKLTDGFTGLFIIVKAIGKAFGFLISVVKTITKPFGGLINIVGSVFQFFGKAVQGVRDFILNTKAISKIPKGILSFVGDLSQKVHDFFVNSTLLKSIPSVLTSLGTGIDNLLVKLKDFISNSKLIETLPGFFSDISDVVKTAISSIKDFFVEFKDTKVFNALEDTLSGIKDFFSSIFDYDLSQLSVKFDSFKESIKDFFTVDGSKVFVVLDLGFEKLADAINSLKQMDLSSVKENIKGFFSAIKKVIDETVEYLSTQNISKVFDKIVAGGVVAALIKLTKTIEPIIDLFKTKGKEVPESANKFIDSIKNVSDSVSKKIDASRLISQSKSILVFSAALIAFSYAVSKLGELDAQDLIRGMVSVFLLIKMMTGAFSSLREAVAKTKAKDLYKAAGAVLLLSFAIKGFAKAVTTMAELDWLQLIKGLTGVCVILSALNKFMLRSRFDSINAKSGLGLMAVAEALNIMSKAIEKIGNLNVAQLAKGLIGVTVMLAAITGFLRFSGDPKHMISTGLGLLIVASSMLVFYKAIQQIGDLKADEISQGLFSIAIVLGLLTAAVNLMPGAKTIAIGAGLMIMAIGIVTIASALKLLSTISGEGLMVALGGIAGSLLALGLLAKLVNPVSLIATSAAIVVFAAGIMLLTPALMALGQLNIKGAVIAISMLAGVFIILGVASLVLTPLIPVMLALGAAIIVLGAGIAVTGAGLLLFSTGLIQFAIAVAANAKAIMDAIETVIIGIVTLLPNVGAALAESVLMFLTTLAEGASKLTDAAVKLGLAFLNGLKQIIPELISTGLTLLLALLRGIEANIEILATVGVSIVAKFILGIARSIGMIIQAGIALMFAFVNGLAQGIRENTEAVVAAARNMMSAVIESILTILEGLLANIPVIGDKIQEGLEKAKEGVRDLFDVEEAEQMSRDYMNKVSKGIDDSVDQVKASGDKAGNAASQPTIEGFNKIDKASQDGMNNMANNITNGQGTVGAAAGGVSQEVINQLKPSLEEAGLTGEQIDAALGQGMTGNLGEVQAGAEGITNVANAEYDKATGQAAKKAKEQSEAYAKALDPKTAATAAKGIAEKVAKNLDAGKKTALAAGKTLVKEFSGAIEKGGSSAKTAGDKTAKQGASGMAGSGAANNAKITGGNIAQGLINGMNAKQQAAYQAGFALGQKAAQGEKDGADVNSPSKIAIKIGKGLGEGLIVGMNYMSKPVYNSGYEMGNMAANSLSDAMTKVYEILNSDLDMSPKITPVLDLSSIHRGINQMDSMLNTRKLSASVSNNMGALAYSRTAGPISSSNSTTSNTVNNFNITVDGAENPEAFANRLVKQFNLKQRMG